jgi:hypothetical protein
MGMLIGFNGRMGVGKSTAIQLLKAISGREVINVKFAQPLYDMQEYIYGRIEGVYRRPADFLKDRKLLQWLGTEWGRESISKTLWVDIWKAEIEMRQYCNKDAIIVCDDVRFENEAEILHKLGGKLVQIVADQSQERTVTGIANHASEAGIKADHIDYLIENNRTIEDFKNSLTYLYRRHLEVGSDEAA